MKQFLYLVLFPLFFLIGCLKVSPYYNENSLSLSNLNETYHIHSLIKKQEKPFNEMSQMLTHLLEKDKEGRIETFLRNIKDFINRENNEFLLDNIDDNLSFLSLKNKDLKQRESYDLIFVMPLSYNDISKTPSFKENNYSYSVYGKGALYPYGTFVSLFYALNEGVKEKNKRVGILFVKNKDNLTPALKDFYHQYGEPKSVVCVDGVFPFVKARLGKGVLDLSLKTPEWIKDATTKQEDLKLILTYVDQNKNKQVKNFELESFSKYTQVKAMSDNDKSILNFFYDKDKLLRNQTSFFFAEFLKKIKNLENPKNPLKIFSLQIKKISTLEGKIRIKLAILTKNTNEQNNFLKQVKDYFNPLDPSQKEKPKVSIFMNEYKKALSFIDSPETQNLSKVALDQFKELYGFERKPLLLRSSDPSIASFFSKAIPIGSYYFNYDPLKNPPFLPYTKLLKDYQFYRSLIN